MYAQWGGQCKSNGLTFYIIPNVELVNDRGQVHARVEELDSKVLSQYGLDYNGKNYGYNDFNGQLRPYFDQLKVATVNLTVHIEGPNPACKTLVGTLLKEGSYSTSSCGTKTNGSDHGYVITRTEITGCWPVPELKAELTEKIRELETQKQKS